MRVLNLLQPHAQVVLDGGGAAASALAALLGRLLCSDSLTLVFLFRFHGSLLAAFLVQMIIVLCHYFLHGALITMQLFVQSVLGNTWKLNGIKDSTRVETLKLLIFRVTGMHPDDQLLLWKQEALQDHRSVSAYSVADGCTLRLHPKIRSGF